MRISLLAGLLLLVVSSSGHAKVWVEESTTKVMKDADAPGGPAEILLEGARNEYVAFQIVLRGDQGPIPDVEVSAGSLTGVSALAIPPENFEFYLEYYLYVENPSDCDALFSTQCDMLPEYNRVPGEYPDALIPLYDPYSEEHGPVAAGFDVPEGDLQTVFADLYIPQDLPAGNYEGEVRVLSGDNVLALIPVRLHVWDFAIPTQRNVATSYGFSLGSIYTYHGGPSPDEETKARLAQNYEFEVHRHRMDYTTHKVGLSFQFDENGELLPVDYSAYDAYIGPRVSGEYYPDGSGLNRFNAGMFRPGHGTMGMTDDQFALAAKDFAEHLTENGWLDNVYLYSLDEPWIPANIAAGSFDKIKKGVDLLNQKTALWKGHVLVTGPYNTVLDGYVDIWCPVTPMYDGTYLPFDDAWPGPDEYAELIELGQELWFYVCNANVPPTLGYDVDTIVGYEPRLTKWGSWFENATGFLYWRINYWQNPDPWHVLVNIAQFGEYMARTGDGILIYPGDHNGSGGGIGSPEAVSLDGPVVSYRTKQVRDGLEDWEVFILGAELGAEEYVREQVSRAYTKFGTSLDFNYDPAHPPWTLDESVLLDARYNIAAKVQYLTHPDLYEDPEEPETSPEEEPEPAPDSADTVEPGAEEVGEPLVEISAEVLPGQDSATADTSSGPEPATAGKSGGCAAGPSGPGASPAIVLLLTLVLAIAISIRTRRRTAN